MYKDIEQIIDDFYKLYYKIEKINIDNSIRCLTANEIYIIDTIDDESTTVNDLANRLEITVGTASSAITKLEHKQFLYRQKDKIDKRKVYIKLTKKGELAKDFYGNFNKSLFEKITKDINKKEIKIFEKVLRQINSNLYLIKENLMPVSLNKLKEGVVFLVYDIKCDEVLFRYLITKGFNIGKEMKVLHKNKNAITLMVDNKELTISLEDANNVLCIKKEVK